MYFRGADYIKDMADSAAEAIEEVLNIMRDELDEIAVTSSVRRKLSFSDEGETPMEVDRLGGLDDVDGEYSEPLV